MSQIREQVKKEDKAVKEHTQHQSQSDAAKGFGGKFGVQKERQDKVIFFLSKLYIHLINVCLRTIVIAYSP